MRGEGGVLEFCLKFQTYSFGHSGGHAKFQNHSFTPSVLFLVSDEEEENEEELLIIIATLATVEVSAGGFC